MANRFAATSPDYPLSISRLETRIGSDPAKKGWYEVSSKHQRRANQFLKATRELAQKRILTAGERMRVSNNAWGALSQTVKAIAALHGWTVVGPESTKNFVRELGRRAKDPNISSMIGGIYALHENYYADHSLEAEVREAPHNTAALIDRLWDAAPSLESGKKPDGARDMQQRRIFKENHTPHQRARVRNDLRAKSKQETRRAIPSVFRSPRVR